MQERQLVKLMLLPNWLI